MTIPTASSSPRCNASEAAAPGAGRFRSAAVALALLAAFAGCGGPTPERARISRAQPVASVDGAALELVQQLQFSAPMLAALDAGVPLRFVYTIETCGSPQPRVAIDLSYSPLTRRYTLAGGGEPRRFGRRSALLAALDRVRLPLADSTALGCSGSVQLAFDVAALPAPLRLPALLSPADWQLVSPTVRWSTATG